MQSFFRFSNVFDAPRENGHRYETKTFALGLRELFAGYIDHYELVPSSLATV